MESSAASGKEIYCLQGSDLIKADKSTQKENSGACEVVSGCDETAAGKQEGEST